MSASVDLPDADWQFVHLSGSWARERHIHARQLEPGRQSISSPRGSSGHQHNPFLLLRRATATEEHGEAIGFSLVYSGNFLVETEVEPYGPLPPGPPGGPPGGPPYPGPPPVP